MRPTRTNSDGDWTDREAEAARRLSALFAAARTPGAPSSAHSFLQELAQRGDAAIPQRLRALAAPRPGGRRGLRYVGIAASLVLVATLTFAGVHGFVWGPGTSPSLMPSLSPSPSPSVSPSPSPTVIPGAISAGYSWQRVQTPAAVAFDSVSHDADGFLATAHEVVGSSYLPSIWRSADGVAWRNVPLNPPSVFTPDVGPSSRTPFVNVSHLARHGDTFVAVGSIGDYDVTSNWTAAAWVSTDAGSTWSRAALEGGANAAIEDVVFGPAGWVAVGVGWSTTGAAVWTSPDGSSWSRLAEQAPFAGGHMLNVVAAPPGYVAVGVRASLALPAPPVWTSSDGRHWSQPKFDLPGTNWSESSAVVAVVDGKARILTSPSISRPDTSVPPTALCTLWGSSADGLAWTAIGSFRADYVASMVATPGGLMAFRPYLADSGSWGTAAVEVWTSPDGATWTVHPVVESMIFVAGASAAYGDGRVVLAGGGKVLVGTPVPGS